MKPRSIGIFILPTTSVVGDTSQEDQFGRMAYLTKCQELGITPASQVLRFLETEEMHVGAYGLGLKGTLSLCEALKARALGGKRWLATSKRRIASLCLVYQKHEFVGMYDDRSFL